MIFRVTHFMNVAGFLRFASVESVSGWSVSGRRVGIFQASPLSGVFSSLPTNATFAVHFFSVATNVAF